MVSVITPTYNRANFLSKMIGFLKNQTFSQWELIIVDDGSDDNSREVVESFKDSRIRYVSSSKNEGAGKRRNQGAKLANGDYIIFLDSDDEVLPNWLEEFYIRINENPVDILCCGYERINAQGRLTSLNLPKNLGEFFNNISANFLAGTIMFNKSLFFEVNGYDDSLPSGQHTDLILRILDFKGKNSLKITTIPMGLIRIIDHKNFKIRNNFEAIYNGTLKLLEKHKNRFLNNKKTHFQYWTIAGVSAARLNQLNNSGKCFLAAFKLFPFDLRNIVRLGIIKVPFLANKIWKVE